MRAHLTRNQGQRTGQAGGAGLGCAHPAPLQPIAPQPRVTLAEALNGFVARDTRNILW